MIVMQYSLIYADLPYTKKKTFKSDMRFRHLCNLGQLSRFHRCMNLQIRSIRQRHQW